MTDFTPRPTVYKGIKMRSRLEAGFAAWLDDRTTFPWKYEPCAFATEDGQYLPDFLLDGVWFEGGVRRAYVEVKPPPHFASGDDEDDGGAWERREAVWHQMGTIWASEPDALLLIAGPGHLDFLYDDSHLRQPWPLEGCVWTVCRGGVCGVAIPASPESQPWPTNWWKGRRPDGA